jgi:hypothetical protein
MHDWHVFHDNEVNGVLIVDRLGVGVAPSGVCEYPDKESDHLALRGPFGRRNNCGALPRSRKDSLDLGVEAVHVKNGHRKPFSPYRGDCGLDYFSRYNNALPTICDHLDILPAAMSLMSN